MVSICIPDSSDAGDEAGMSALVGPGEVHWFRNDSDENFSFVEFWAPPPTGTVWTVEGDRCTWRPVAGGR
jgi:hypothetical protein